MILGIMIKTYKRFYLQHMKIKNVDSPVKYFLLRQKTRHGFDRGKNLYSMRYVFTLNEMATKY